MTTALVSASRYYFSARFSTHPVMRRRRDELFAAVPGATVTSRWIDPDSPDATSVTEDDIAKDSAGTWRFAAEAMADLEDSDTLVCFTGGGGRGGRHAELGYFLALARPDDRRRVVVVGPREHIFHCCPQAEVFDTWEAFLDAERRRCGRSPSTIHEAATTSPEGVHR